MSIDVEFLTRVYEGFNARDIVITRFDIREA